VANLALFDFDGTITSKDTSTPFIFHAVQPARMAIGKVVLSPLIIAYKLGVLSASRMRRSIVRFGFRGRLAADIRRAGLEYSRGRLASVVRAQALERIRWHQAQGDEVVVVSASLDVYLEDWCRQVGVQLICTQLEHANGVLTGRYRDGDCSGPEKARRVRERYDLERFAVVYAYGDTPEDDAMLRLASERFYRWQLMPR
jgi:HAD superfamily hydrolase (TIGR01490 family)